jgi:hypothetical protein
VLTTDAPPRPIYNPNQLGPHTAMEPAGS